MIRFLSMILPPSTSVLLAVCGVAFATFPAPPPPPLVSPALSPYLLQVAPDTPIDTLEEKLRSLEITIDGWINASNDQFRAARLLVPSRVSTDSLVPLMGQMEGVMWVEQDFRVKIASPQQSSVASQQAAILTERDAPWVYAYHSC